LYTTIIHIVLIVQMNLIGQKQLKKNRIPNYKAGESPTFYLGVMIKCIRVYKNIKWR